MPADAPSTGAIEVRLLGPVEVLVDGALTPLRRGRQQLLLTSLALQAGRPVSADRLVEELWPGEQPEDPANALQHLVARIRAALGPARTRLVTSSSAYRLDIHETDVDVGRVRALVQTARSLLDEGRPGDAWTALTPALSAWRGVPLADVHDGPLTVEAAALTELRASVDVLAADIALALGTDQVLQICVERLARSCPAHPFHESLWERRIAVLARSGRAADALAAYETVRVHLADELGADPGIRLRSLYAQLLSGSLTPSPAGIPQSTGRGHSRLPALPSTRFFGREADLALLGALLSRDGVRLVTVVGTSGVGKTRLAMEYAHRSDRPVTLVLLDAIDCDSDVAAAVAATLMLREVGSRSLPDVLAESLPADGVLLLDNAEHVLGRVSDLVIGVLAQRPDVTVLVTSQWPLGLPAEHLVRLEVPAGVAVPLLIDRVATSRPDLPRPAEEDLAAAAVIVDLLDGLPLALELAAAQARHLTLPQLATTLQQSLDLLDRETLRHRSRHRRLTDAVDWSLELLTAHQKDFLIECSALAGVFDPALAAAVTDRTAEACMSLLLDLADRSVVHVVPPTIIRSQLRFCILRPLRVHARRHLGRAGREDVVLDRLLDWVVRLAEEGDDGIRGPHQLVWLARLDDARADIEAALHHALDTRRLGDAARAVSALGRYWDWRGRLRDAARWTSSVIDAVGPEDDATVSRLAAVLAWQAFVAVERGDDAEVARLTARARGLAQPAGDVDAELTALAAQSLLVAPGEGLGDAMAAILRALQLAELHQHPWGQAWAINRRGHLHLMRGRLDQARADAHDSARRFAALSDQRAMNWARLLLALVDHADPQAAAPRQRATDVLTAAQELGDLRTAAQAAALLAALTDDDRSRTELTHLAAGLRAQRIQQEG